jgi:uncharacterized protein (DUF302 family)
MLQLVVFLIGALAGAAVLALVLSRRAPSLMLTTDRSRLDFAGTVQGLQDAAAAAGWKVQTIHPISEVIADKGFHVRPATVIEICRADLAGRILADEAGRRVTSLLPCRVAIHEDDHGGVLVSRMNSRLMSRLFGGVVQEIMSEATESSEAAFAPLLDR